MRKRIILSILILFSTLILVACNKEDIKPMTDEEVSEKLESLNDYGLDLFQKGDNLPLFRPEITSEQTSSYSRNGNNTDGFGMGGNVDGEVNSLSIRRPLLILNQPGVVYRMWFTTWESAPTLTIMIDGQTPYRFNLDDMTSGEFDNFYKPLVFDREESSGSYVSYVPMVFKESIEIYGSGNFYFNINFQKYPHGTQLEYDDFDNNLEPALNIMGNPGVDPKIANNDITTNKTFNLGANDTKTIYESNTKQTVTALKVRFPNLTVNEFDRTIYEDDGYRLNKGSSITFDLNAKSAGRHTLIFRGVLNNDVRQEASVLLNGTIASRDLVIRQRRLDGFEWKDDDYFEDTQLVIEIPSAGKHSIKITAKSNFIELYNVRLVESGNETDSLDFGVESQENKHNFSSSGLVAPRKSTLEYDPNTLIDQTTWAQIFSEEDLINQVYIKISYPDLQTPAVLAPIATFFGFGQFGLFKTLGLMVGLDADGWMYSYYPMPFEKGIKIELINHSEISFSNLEAIVSYETNQFENGTYGYFKTNYVENIFDSPTGLKNGVPIDVLNVEGTGHVVGITHSQTGAYFGLHSRYYLEGDEQIYLDGSLGHAFHGTGTEDLYNGSWYFKNGVQTTPLFGQSNHNYRGDRDRTVMVRTFLTDPIYFKNGIDFKIEHGGNNDRADSDVYLLTYYYHQERALLVKTDSMNLNNQEDINTHNYQFDDRSEFTNLGTSGYTYEGLHIHQRTNYTMMATVIEESSFELEIFNDNDGAILRREYLLEHINQAAEIYVDGKLVGIWQSPHRNAFGYFVRQDDFYIPASFTKDKDKITITVKVQTTADSYVWTESYYEIYSIMK